LEKGAWARFGVTALQRMCNRGKFPGGGGVKGLKV
jgi:hypothetical protein